MSLYYDNKAAINISHNPGQHDHTKHIKVDHHFIWEELLCRLIYAPFVTMEQQFADVFTKGVIKAQLHEIISKLYMYGIHTPAWGGVLK